MSRLKLFSFVVVSVAIVLLVVTASPRAALAFDPANDDFDAAVVIGALEYTDTLNTSSATAAADDPTDCTNNGSVWYEFTPATDTVIVADTFGSNYDTVLSAYTGTRGSLTLVPGACNDDYSGLQSRIVFGATAGVTYYFLIGFCCGNGSDGGGDLVFTVNEGVAPDNDDFANASLVAALPFSDNVDTIGATLETGEPSPSCASDISGSVWYVFTPATTESISANAMANFSTAVAAYSGDTLNNLTEVACETWGLATFPAEAGTTYYFQASGQYGDRGPMQFTLDVAPQPEAYFYYWPSEPSIFSMVEFWDSSYDPAGAQIVSWMWDFGDGTSGDEYYALHQYAEDGDYTVQLTITTADGRTDSTDRVVEVRTHDVSITKFSVPMVAKEGNTARNVTVGITNKRYPENVRVDLYKSVPGPYQNFEHVGSLTQSVPMRSGRRTIDFSFSYTFSSEDASVGKVNFKAVATIINASDALSGDNEAISKPIVVNSRR